MAKRGLGIIIFILCIFLCLSCHVCAVSTADAAEQISPEQLCTLTIYYGYHGTAFSDVPVKLYKVADISQELQYTLTPAFLSSNLQLNGIQSNGEWNVIRSTLESHIMAYRVRETHTAVTDHTGLVCFDDLKPGLYLATTEDLMHSDTLYCFDSALISLPGLDMDGRWQYQVAVSCKSEAIPPIGPDGMTEFKVIKLWKQQENPSVLPRTVEIEIFRNGISDQIVILSEQNHWSHSWTTTEGDAKWIVVERNVPAGYAVTVEKRGSTFVVTNTRISDATFPETENPNISSPTTSPNTGDTPHILLFTILMYASGAILILLGLTGKRKQS